MSSPAKFLGIGVIVAGTALAFAYVGGWLTPQRLSPPKLIDTVEASNGGAHAGFRRNHAKGLCVTGFFESSGAGVPLSHAAVFAPGRVPVIGRFALAGGQPFQADAPTSVRSFALQFNLPNGEQWRTGMNAIPVFPFRTPEIFYQQMVASTPDPATGKPDPNKIAAFFAAHPEAMHAIQIIGSEKPSSGFANSRFNSLDAFVFVAADGSTTAVRWALVPDEPFAPDDPAAGARSNNYLFEAVVTRLQHSPLQWHLMVAVAQTGDPTNDPSQPWPVDRKQVDVGTLTINQAQGEDTGGCRDINYDPLILPSGIEPSDDPMLSARSAAYSESFRRRTGEAKPPSAVQTTSGQTGAGT